MHNVGILTVVGIVLVGTAVAQTGPIHCSYSDGVYECDYDKMTSTSDRPIYYNDFSVQPQQLVLNANGFLPYFGDATIFDSDFSTSSSMDVTQFDSNYPAWLEINCGWSGSAYIDTGAFSDMEYIQYFKIKNCDIFYLNVDAVDAFRQLDYFGIEGGTIDTVEALAMEGLTVEKLTTATHQFPRLQGKFEILNTKFEYGVVNIGLLDYFTNVTSITLKNAGITYLSSDLFQYNTYLTLVDLSDNLFTKLPVGFLDNQLGLSELTLYNIDWECTCANLWWVEACDNQNITVTGDTVCSNIQGTSVFKYYYENCVTTNPCEGKTGVAVGDKCQSILSIVVMCLAFISLAVTSTSLALAIINFRNIQTTDDEDPVVLDRLKLRARQRWRKATRHIIYFRRTGKPIYGLESEGSKTMSIPDETKSHGRSSSFGNSSFGDYSIGESSAEELSYAGFPFHGNMSGQNRSPFHEHVRGQNQFKYTEL